MDENQDRDGDERIKRRLLEAVLQQGRVLKELDRRARNLRVDPPQVTDEFLLLLPVPNIFLRIDLQQVFPVHADKTVPQRFGQILGPQSITVVLILDRIEGFTHVLEQRLLELGEL